MDNNKDQMQEIRMCIQTYFNLHGSIPSKQIMVDWLGTSYEEQISDQMECFSLI